MVFLTDPSGEGGEAADTGSAVHKGAEAFHKGKGVAASLEVMKACSAEYPRADLQDAAKLFLSYALDPRNSEGVEFPLIEHTFTFEIAPHETDKTQATIVVEGTTDQVRRKRGERPKAWDIKTSKKDPTEVRLAAMFQLAAYCIGASIELGEQVEPGGFIMPRRYRDPIAESPVFINVPWTFHDIEQILLPVRKRVAEIRNGELYHVPNKDCTWCVARTPDICLPRLQLHLRQRA